MISGSAIVEISTIPPLRRGIGIGGAGLFYVFTIFVSGIRAREFEVVVLQKEELERIVRDDRRHSGFLMNQVGVSALHNGSAGMLVTVETSTEFIELMSPLYPIGRKQGINSNFLNQIPSFLDVSDKYTFSIVRIGRKQGGH